MPRTQAEVPARIRALIVDDEPLAADCVRLALEKQPDIELVGSCASGIEALGAIRDLRPDLVFLDVQMPGMDGFDVIDEIGPDAMPEVVFVTAYDEHALHAFEVHAVDYLLKPFDDARFAECTRHAVRRVRGTDNGAQISKLGRVLRDAAQDTAGRGAQPVTRFLIRERDRMRFVQVDQVDWLEAAGNYVRLHVGPRTHLMRAALAELAAQLDRRHFVRIHRSTIVNVRRICEIQPWSGGDYIAILNDGTQLRVSRTYRDDFLQPMV